MLNKYLSKYKYTYLKGLFHLQVPSQVPCVNLTPITKNTAVVEKFQIEKMHPTKVKTFSTYYGTINFPSVMGGVCKVWLSIHRSLIICDY